MHHKLVLVLVFLTPIFSKEKIHYSHSGYFTAATIHRLSDGSIIKIPYRILSYEPVLSFNNFNIVANTALEFRLKDIDKIMESDLTPDLRELYVEWISPIGDFSLGKQIITWGAASENNPTDNISPYNYYYLFSMGKERKEGIFSLNSTLYFNDSKLNTVLIPQHNTNILPLNDSEFAISSPILPKDEQINDINNPFEYGFSINVPIQSIDVAASYFSGHDRIVSFFGANVWTGQWSNPHAIKQDIVLSYRHTEMFGLGFSSSSNNVFIKGDLGYFITDDKTINTGDSTLYRYWESGIEQIIQDCEEYNVSSSWDTDFEEIVCAIDPKFNNSEVIDNSAKYFQFTLEMEYSPTYDFNIIGQITGSHLLEIGFADSIKTSEGTIMFDPEEYFMPGMGSPNTFISSNALSISARKLFPDIGLELRLISMFDLDKKGSLYETGIEYEIYENTNLLIAVNKIFDDNQNNPENPFTGMVDFSHIRFELKYFY